MSGIIGVYSPNAENVVDSIFTGLAYLQHRGEIGAGISVAGKDIGSYSNEGLVYNAIGPVIPILNTEALSLGIGHTRFGTKTGLQPIQLEGDNYTVSFAMDGTILGMNEREVGEK